MCVSRCDNFQNQSLNNKQRIKIIRVENLMCQNWFGQGTMDWLVKTKVGNASVTMDSGHTWLVISIVSQKPLRVPLQREAVKGTKAGLIQGLRSANERRRYKVTPSPIGWAQTKNQPCKEYCPAVGCSTSQWCHNERDGVSNHWRFDCLLNCLFRHRSKKTTKLRSLAFVRGIHWWPVDSPQKGPITQKMFPFDYVIIKQHTPHFMITLWNVNAFRITAICEESPGSWINALHKGQ